MGTVQNVTLQGCSHQTLSGQAEITLYDHRLQLIVISKSLLLLWTACSARGNWRHATRKILKIDALRLHWSWGTFTATLARQTSYVTKIATFQSSQASAQVKVLSIATGWHFSVIEMWPRSYWWDDKPSLSGGLVSTSVNYKLSATYIITKQ